MNVINGSAFAGALGSRQRGLLQEPVVSRFIKPTPNLAHAAAHDDDDDDNDGDGDDSDDGDVDGEMPSSKIMRTAALDEKGF